MGPIKEAVSRDLLIVSAYIEMRDLKEAVSRDNYVSRVGLYRDKGPIKEAVSRDMLVVSAYIEMRDLKEAGRKLSKNS